MSKPLPDQKDLEREIVHLKGESAKIEMKCAEAGVDFPPRPKLADRRDIFEERGAMAAHFEALKPKAELAEALLAARKISEAGPGRSLPVGSSADGASSPASILSLQQITALVAERDALKKQVAELDALRLRAESAEARLDVVTKERDTLKANAADFNRRVAAEICKFGIRATAVELPAEPKMNATQRALMSK